jgi:hypothetical protein
MVPDGNWRLSPRWRRDEDRGHSRQENGGEHSVVLDLCLHLDFLLG